MQVGMLGMSYKTATLAELERFSLMTEALWKTSVYPSVFLSTCHRSELYFSGRDVANIAKEWSSALQEYNIYVRLGVFCIQHLVRVISGIDSALLGETEIQGQVKRAYRVAAESAILSAELHYLFQKGLKLGKEIRTFYAKDKTTDKIHSKLSLESVLWELMQSFLSPVLPTKVLCIGYSEINRRILAYLRKKQELMLTLSTRQSVDVGFALLPWQEHRRFVEFDIVIVGSTSPQLLLTWDHLMQETLCTKLLIDLSVPRLIDPMIGKHPKISLLNMEELGEILEKKKIKSFAEEQILHKHIEECAKRQEILWQEKQTCTCK